MMNWFHRGEEVIKSINYEEFMKKVAAIPTPHFFEDQSIAVDIGQCERVESAMDRALSLKKVKAQKNQKEQLDAEYLHHPKTRIQLFFENSHSIAASYQLSMPDELLYDFYSLASESASIMYVLVTQ